MKKKLVSILLVTMCAVAVVGCKKDLGNLGEAISNSGTENNKENNSGNHDENTEGSDEFILGTGYDSDYICTVDKTGNKVGSYKYETVKSDLDKAGYNIDDMVIKAAGDGVLYFQSYDYTKDETESSIVAVDTISGKVSNVYTIPTGFYVDSVDVYKGEIYICMNNSDKELTEEHGFKQNLENLSFTEDKKAYTKLDGYSTLYNRNGKNNSIARSLDEIGFVLLNSYDSDKNESGMYTGDDEIKTLDWLSGKKFSAWAYDKDYFIYQLYDEEYNGLGYYMYNFKTKEEIAIDEPDIYRTIGMKDGVFYYLLADQSKFNSNKYQVLGYNLDTCVSDVIYEFNDTPGVYGISSYVDLFGNNIFTGVLSGSDLKWIRVDGKDSVKDIDCVIKSVNAFKYGTIIADSHEQLCPDCSLPVYKDYEEAFVLDDSYSSKAKQINASLKKRMTNALAYQKDDVQDDCEEHKEYPEQYCETDETTVSDVRIVNDNYLVVDMNSYWYGGGAHGMPGRGEYVYDLKTGEELKLSDFYKGSEEDFKKLIADKVKADYESHTAEDYTGYFAESADEVYNQAYEYASIDSGNYMFTEDAVIYYFYPYDLASYADGFKEYSFTYQEFFGTDALSR